MELQTSQDMVDQLTPIFQMVGIPFTADDAQALKDHGAEWVSIDIVNGFAVSQQDVINAVEVKPTWTLVQIVDCVLNIDRWVMRVTITNGAEIRTDSLNFLSEPSPQDRIDTATVYINQLNT